MLEAGSIVVAEIRGIEQDGVRLKYGESEVFVDLSNVTWSRFRHLTDVVSIGDTAKVKVLGFNEARRAYSGSMKALRPELNPYIPLAGRPPNARLRGIIRKPGLGRPPFVEFDSGARGSLDEASLAREHYPGQVVEVVITRVAPNADEDNLEVRVVDLWTPPADK